MIKILIISFLALTLAGCSTPPGLKTATVITLLPGDQSITATDTTDTVITDTDNIEEESLNGQDDLQEVEAEEADGKVEVIEPANEQDQESSLPNGGHQDQDNTEVDHQFEGVE